MPAISTTLKTLLQYGPAPLALYATYQLGLRTGYYRRKERQGEDPERGTASPAPPHPLFELPDRQLLLTALGAPALAALFTEADEIMEGQVRLFGSEPVPLQLASPKPLQHWSVYETGRVELDGDIKYLWEPARFGWACILGRAYHVSHAEKYAQAFWKQAEIFLDSNPPYLGPQWMNGQEIALRLMALAWAAQVFAVSPASTPERLVRLAQSIAQHAERIALTLAYARAQNNNHLVSEAAGLYTAGLALPDHPRSAVWRQLGWRWLNKALQRQIGSFGEYIQHSTNYHRLVLHCALYVNAIKTQAWPRASAEALGRAAAWLFSLLDPISGQAPNLGANDGALVLPLSSSAFSDYRPAVQAAARAFLNSGLPAGPWDEMSFWLGLPAPEKTLEPGEYLSDNLRGEESWAYLRTTTFKSLLGHMDQLHFDLWWRGLNITQDAGSYQYNAPAPWDNPLVTSRVHNTVSVDGLDQMTRAGRFMTLDWFPAYAKTVIDSDERILQKMIAWYKTRRLRHERTVTVYMDGHWLVADKLVTPGKAAHTFRLHWLLPDWEWEINGTGIGNRETGIVIRFKSPYGLVTLRMLPDHQIQASDCQLTIVRAGEVLHGPGPALPFEGWVSRTYGQKTPALSLALTCTATQTITFISEFAFPT